MSFAVRQLGYDAAAADSLVSTLAEALRRVVVEVLGDRPDLHVADTSSGFRVTGSVAYEEWLESRVQDPDRRALIGQLLLMSLDHSTSIGNEIVHDLVVGHLLYGFMVRPDRVAAMASAGALDGQQLILDTPVLLGLMGGDESARPLRNLLARACALNIEVVLYNRTVDELKSLLDGYGAGDEAGQLDDALLRGADPSVRSPRTGRSASSALAALGSWSAKRSTFLGAVASQCWRLACAQSSRSHRSSHHGRHGEQMGNCRQHADDGVPRRADASH